MHSSFHPTDADPVPAARLLMQKAYNQDGLPEMAVGIAFLTTAGLNWMQGVSKPGLFGSFVVSWGLILLVAPMALVSQWVIKKVRLRFLIEKVGYVEFKPANRKRIAIIFVFAFVVGVAAAFALAFTARKGAIPSASWVLAGTGILGGALAAYAGRLTRYAVYGGIMVGTGILLAFSGVKLEAGFAILYGFIGLLCLISGCVVLLLFIRKHDQAGE